MSFLHETDYHGSRTYQRERGAPAVLSELWLGVSLTIAWARLQAEKLLRLGAAPIRTSSLVHDGEKHFTALGTRQRPVRARRPITDIFPIASSNDWARKLRNDN